MLLFLYEYISAACPNAPASLKREGLAMLKAAVDDFRILPGLEVLLPIRREGEAELGLHDPVAEERFFRRLARQAEWTLVIAPEFDDILARRCKWVLEEGGKLLGCTPDTIRLCGDKKRLAKHLACHKISTPPIQEGIGPVTFPAVVKPRFGAGMQSTYFIWNQDKWAETLNQHKHAETPNASYIVQPWLEGVPASISCLIGPNRVEFLPAGEQLIRIENGKGSYEGGVLPIDKTYAERARNLAKAVLKAVDGLAGFVGIDMVMGADSSQDAVIEVNPRLTTSYVGLRRLAKHNLAENWLRIVRGELPPANENWSDERLRFYPDGGIEIL